MGTMDELINPTVISALSRSLKTAALDFEPHALSKATRQVGTHRLRDRVDIVRDALLADAPGEYLQLEQLVRSALEQPSFTGWMIWPVTEAVTTRALASGTAADFDAAMDLLASLTLRLSSEFAIRDLLNARPERALSKMTAWAGDENEHVRRLATEGSRAYLPWARRVPWLIEHPLATRAILDATYRDATDYVRRSAANHLNDLSRVDPGVVTDIAGGWHATPDANTPWVLRHGLRTLIKKADPQALALLGFTGDRLRVDRPRLSSSTIPQGGAISFTAVVANDGDTEAAVAIDYSIGFLRANGALSPKTFKLASRRLAPGESVVVTKAHSFRPITTRAYYPGAHYVTVQANGTLSPRADFTLEAGAGTQATQEKGESR